jgi:hypothetical protein
MTICIISRERPRRRRPSDGTRAPWSLHRRLTIAAIGLASTATVQAQSPTYPAARWQWASVVQAGGSLEVRLVRGSVRAERISGQQATVTVVRRSARSDPLTTELSVDTAGMDFRIVDRYPGPHGANQRGDCLPPLDTRGDFWHSDVRVDAVVRVPSNVRLIVRLMDGDIDVRPLSGPRDASSNQGAVLGEAHRP